MSDLPAHLDVADTDKVGRLYNVLRKELGFLPNESGTGFEERMSIEDFRGLFSGETVTKGMFEECQLVNSIYADAASRIVEREEAVSYTHLDVYKRQVGATAVALVGAAATVVTAGIAAGEGAAAGFAAAGAGGAQGAGTGSSASTAASSGRLTAASTGSNQPAPPQLLPASTSSSVAEAPTIEGHADQIRSSFSDVMGSGSSDTQPESEAAETAVPTQVTGATSGGSSSSPRTSAPARRGPTVHRYNIGTWGAYHAARVAAQGLASISPVSYTHLDVYKRQAGSGNSGVFRP